MVLVIALTFVSLPANVADDTFEYIDGPTGGGLNTILYYEVAKDYTIDIKEYLSVLSDMPDEYFKWDKTEAQRLKLLMQVIRPRSLDLISRGLVNIYRQSR